MILLLLSVLVVTIAYYFAKVRYNYWKAKGVPGPKPTFIVGNVGPCLILKKQLGDVVTDTYRQYENASMVGIFKAFTPSLIIRDTDLIRDIMIKEFSHFHDNDMDLDIDIDPLVGRNPFFLNGEKWKTARVQLTPCFTSGKMKYIYPLLQDISERLVKFIDSELKTSAKNGLEAKELCTKFTLNNVASCAFGLEGQCFEDPNSHFRQIAYKFLTPSGWTSFIFLFGMLVPSVLKYCKIKMVKKDLEDELLHLVGETLKYRRENNIERNDFLQIMSQMKSSGKEQDFTELDITAHAANFFADGYETSSIVMSFLLYELADNPRAQTKLRAEVQKAFAADNGSLKYETLQSIEYLDAVFDESIRLHPIIQILMKRCTKTFVYNPKSDDNIQNPITIEKGTSVILPIGGLHTDPKYFENPDSFLPERFLPENKQSITKFSYLPFGEGPRACLGMRFAILQIKIGVAYIIKNYELSVNPKTQRPLKYDPYYFMLSPIGGLWLDFKKI